MLNSAPSIQVILICTAGAVVGFMILRDLMFRIFFLFPFTKANGKFAAFIEDYDIFRWTIPVLQENDNPKDLAFVGNSHVMDAIDPNTITNQTGLKSFNIALYSYSIPNILELLIQFNYFPKIIIIDFSTRYSTYIEDAISPFAVKRVLDLSPLKKQIFDIVDRIHCVFPSIFIRKPYYRLFSRGLRKLKIFRETGRPTIGRYSPFRRLASYNWGVEKSTNHRHVIRLGGKSEDEEIYEKYLLKMCMDESKDFCEIGGAKYIESFQRLDKMLETITGEGTKVIFMRLPLHPKMIDLENNNYAQYFEDLRSLADKFSIDMHDLTNEETLKKIGKLNFYSDGQHVDAASCTLISNYLSTLINTEYKTHD